MTTLKTWPECRSMPAGRAKEPTFVGASPLEVSPVAPANPAGKLIVLPVTVTAVVPALVTPPTVAVARTVAGPAAVAAYTPAAERLPAPLARSQVKAGGAARGLPNWSTA